MKGIEFVSLVEDMRQAQNDYFRLSKVGSADQKKQALQKSKALEAKVDACIVNQKKAQFQLF